MQQHQTKFGQSSAYFETRKSKMDHARFRRLSDGIRSRGAASRIGAARGLDFPRFDSRSRRVGPARGKSPVLIYEVRWTGTARTKFFVKIAPTFDVGSGSRARTTLDGWDRLGRREFRGLTQGQLADAAGISKPYLSQIGTGKCKGTLAKALNVTLEEVIVREAE